jgi:hypothetical protein
LRTKKAAEQLRSADSSPLGLLRLASGVGLVYPDRNNLGVSTCAGILGRATWVRVVRVVSFSEIPFSEVTA